MLQLKAWGVGDKMRRGQRQGAGAPRGWPANWPQSPPSPHPSMNPHTSTTSSQAWRTACCPLWRDLEPSLGWIMGGCGRKIDVTMVSSTATPQPRSRVSSLGRKEGRPPGSHALASRNLLGPTASSPASHNGVSGKQSLQDLGTVTLHYADHPFQSKAPSRCSQNLTHTASFPALVKNSAALA